MARCLGGDAEGVGDLLVGLSDRERKQDLELAVGQAGGQLAWPFGDAVSGRGEHGVDAEAQSAFASVAQQFGLGARGVERGPVRARLSHRLVGVGGCEDARRSAERRRAQSLQSGNSAPQIPYLTLAFGF
ncbi:MAG: hypothetical protein ACLP01_07095 [Solirubrobacteraceae bacterium]